MSSDFLSLVIHGLTCSSAWGEGMMGKLAFRISSLFTCVKMWAACSALSRASCSAGWNPAWSSSIAGTRRCCRSTGKEMVIMLQSSSKKIATPSTYLEEEGADHVSVRLWHDPQLGLGAAQLALVVHSSPLPVPAHKFYLYFAIRHQGTSTKQACAIAYYRH